MKRIISQGKSDKKNISFLRNDNSNINTGRTVEWDRYDSKLYISFYLSIIFVFVLSVLLEELGETTSLTKWSSMELLPEEDPDSISPTSADEKQGL